MSEETCQHPPDLTALIFDADPEGSGLSGLYPTFECDLTLGHGAELRLYIDSCWYENPYITFFMLKNEQLLYFYKVLY